MARLIIVIVLLSTSTFAAAETTSQASTQWEHLRTFDARPCEYWSSSINGGFVCQNSPYRKEMPEGRSTSRVIRQLQLEVDALKERILDLEAKQF